MACINYEKDEEIKLYTPSYMKALQKANNILNRKDSVETITSKIPYKEKEGRGSRGPRPKKYKISSKTGYKGVYKASAAAAHKNPFVAQLSFWKPNGKEQVTIHIGSFPTADEAHKARVAFIADLI